MSVFAEYKRDRRVDLMEPGDEEFFNPPLRVVAHEGR